MKKILILMALIAGCVTTMQAQWVDDPAVNTLISTKGEGSATLTKVAKISEDRMYVAWTSFESYDGSLNAFTKLQLLDKNGNALWEKGGIYVSRHPSASYTTDFSLAVTPDDCAIVAFSDSRTNLETKIDFKPYVYKIDQEGNFLWGLDGVAIPCSSHQGMRPRIGVTNAGSVIVGYSDAINGLVCLQRIKEDGTLAWGQNIELGGMMVNFVATGEDDFIITWGGLAAQRYDSYGEEVWDKPVIIEGEFFNGYVEPRMMEDGQGGFVVCYGRTVSMSEFYVCLQRVSADGELMMGLESITTGKSNYKHACGIMGVDIKNQEIICQWSKSRGDNDVSLVANKFSYFGDPMWGDNGVKLKESWMFPPYASNVTVLDDQSSILVYSDLLDSSVKTKIIALKLDKDGKVIWKKEINSLTNYKMNVTGCKLENQLCVFWNSAVSSDIGGEIMGQNISFDGQLGIVGTSIEETENGKSTRIYYDNQCIQATFAGNNSDLADLTVSDLTGSLVYSDSFPVENGQLNAPLSLPRGIYLVCVNSNGQKIYQKIMVK